MDAKRLAVADRRLRFLGAELRSFNMEITNRCVLGCPECARTGNPWVLDHLVDLPLDVIEHALPLSERDRLEGLRANLCGAHGDCIYHRDFHAVLAHLKALGMRVTIETNGSHRKAPWWERTCALLGEEDAIVFSVDGLEDTNHLYRVNARWEDIERAMRLAAARVAVDWKFIVFRHNEHQIEAARALAADIGVRSISFKKSARFRPHDRLAPRDARYVGTVARNRAEVAAVVRGGAAAALDAAVAIGAKCRAGKALAITARGYFFPCTSCESADTTSWFHANREHFDLRRHSLPEILDSPKWRELERSWEQASSAPRSCLYYCGVHRDFDRAYRRESRPDRPYKPEDLERTELAAAPGEHSR